MDLISVIVPIYQVEKYLGSCVESIVSQTYRNLEIILVDDGSPDNCPAICDQWAEKDDRIRVIHKNNGGLSDARNAGLELATGEYIAFVDSDDWINEHYIEYLYEAIRQTDADLAACDISIVLEGKEVQTISRKMPVPVINTPEEALSTLLIGRGYRAVVWNKLYKRKLLCGETFEVGKLHEDEFFSYRIYDKCTKLTYIDLPLYNYLQREGSIMATYSVRHLDSLEAYSRRLILLQRNYPKLYEKDKFIFCVSCFNQYCDALGKKFEGQKDALNIIKTYRRKVHFSFSEWLKQPFKNKVYIIGTNAFFITLFALIRNAKRNL